MKDQIKWKKSRRLDFSLLENRKEFKKADIKKATERAKGIKPRRKVLSGYGKQLQEKQKLRFLYNVSERQFRRLFGIAQKAKGVTGLEFLRILESRLDNVVYRLLFAPTRAAARQLVAHGHILVNGKKVDIPSYLVKVNDEISIKATSHGLKVITDSLATSHGTVAYVSVDRDAMKGSLSRLPERNELNQEIDEHQIIEYYNRLL
ncbi:MAG: 30S ribosomal protein S4 [Erysipelotrichaceae bacterium]|jgi:small subunit ribosomal protein S4|nr:30S ribosomal protein S4 [Erysipelotrichaceae bacterium]